MADHWTKPTMLCRCGRRCPLVTVQPSALAPGAKPVIGYWCPSCDTAHDTTK
jgi:hypothetical protein